MEYDRVNLAWAGGLFDGEGSISHHRVNGSRGSTLEYPQVSMAMTDEDLVEKFRAVMGLGTVNLRHPKPGGLAKLPLFVWQANSFEACQAVIALLWPYLGQRRQGQATRVLNVAKESQVHRKTMRRGKECSVDGCSEPVLARGLCRSDWRKANYAARKDIPCVVEGCPNRPNGARGMCRWHTQEYRRASVIPSQQ